MQHGPESFARARGQTDAFRHGSRQLILLIAGLALLLALVVAGVLIGPGFEPGSKDPLWASLAGLFLAALIGVFGWVLRRRPVAVTIGPEGIDVPLAFARPFPWARMHRIRRCGSGDRLHGRRDWLIVDPAPGALPDFRWPTWRWAEMQAHRWQKIRIPLHALDADPEEVVASVERFRPVKDDRG